MLRARTASPPMASQEDPAAILRWRVVLFACWPACRELLPVHTPRDRDPRSANKSGVHDPRPAPLVRRRVCKPQRAGLLLARTGPAPAGQRFPLEGADRTPSAVRLTKLVRTSRDRDRVRLSISR
jgi:hypothetical protein